MMSATEAIDDTERMENKNSEGEDRTMHVTINNTDYEVELDSNITVDEIVNKLPLDLTLVRYAEHEYYAELPFTPAFAKETTSNIKAGHLYYWDGWNAFVINFEDYDITPYKVVHIGEIKSSQVSDMLRKADKNINVSVYSK